MLVCEKGSKLVFPPVYLGQGRPSQNMVGLDMPQYTDHLHLYTASLVYSCLGRPIVESLRVDLLAYQMKSDNHLST